MAPRTQPKLTLPTLANPSIYGCRDGSSKVQKADRQSGIRWYSQFETNQSFQGSGRAACARARHAADWTALVPVQCRAHCPRLGLPRPSASYLPCQPTEATACQQMGREPRSGGFPAARSEGTCSMGHARVVVVVSTIITKPQRVKAKLAK
ncbi:hypothetical protein B0T24DRAFT_626635 [Lasiosphaeria ovina]|uniref:Uncharacterized protein n=1 Tax=Lasiosphaeria ovina TaxID=92902 RepID=A0AAE0KDA1_9PEZI|nr:hypothetical protein B0T24DRAFT_626635 [Lasiosphaeria ovina]